MLEPLRDMFVNQEFSELSYSNTCLVQRHLEKELTVSKNKKVIL